MHRKIFFSSLFVLFITTAAFSQCKDCDKNENNTTFCYQNEKFETYCAIFEDGATSVKLSKGKKNKSKIIPLKTSASLEDLIAISQNKKLKISATDILFLQEGLKVWVLESRKLGHEYTESGLGIKMLKEGNGAFPEKGKNVKVHYTGYLEDGTKFDSSVDRNEPFSFPLGQGRVIKGWDEGVSKLKIGSKALLKIPAELGYGARGAGGVIPPNATLYFEIEVLGVE